MATTAGNVTKRAKWKKQWMKILDGPYPQTFLSILLIVSLFLTESWTLGNAPDSSNDVLYGILLSIFIIFCVEVVALCILQADYLWSFFFWMDIIGTVSIILDIGWIADSFLPSGALSGQGSVIRATRAAKLGARYGRLLRLMRLMKLNTLLACFGGPEEQEYEPTMSAIKKVSERLSSMLSMRTAALTMLLVIVVPFLSYNVNETSPDTWITNAKLQAKNASVTSYDLHNLVRKCRNFYEPKDRQLEYMSIQSPYVPVVEETLHTRDVLRAANLVEYTSHYYVSEEDLMASGNALAIQYASNGDAQDKPGYVRFTVSLHMDDTVVQQQQAMFGILIIVLVIVVLVGFTASYASSVKTLVVQPLEKMMLTLRSSATLMITSLKELEQADIGKNGENAGAGPGANADKGDAAGPSSSDEEADADLETAQLEQMVGKLSRIVRHVLPASAAVAVDASVDQNTSNWLSQAYSAGATVKRNLNFLRPITERASHDGSTSSVEMMVKVTKMELNSWAFDVLEHSDAELVEIMGYMFNLLNLFHEFRISVPVFKQFLTDVSGRYLNNKYHNFKHGCDVCHTTYRLLLIAQLHTVFTPLEVYALLIAAIAHDVGHPGVNNLFLLKSKHSLALQHNDQSPLENMHCVLLYEILAKESSNVFAGLKEGEWREARKIILTAVLGTDMSHHFEQISKTQLFLEVHGDDTREFCAGQRDVITCLADEKHRLFVMELLLHCSDISNPYKPYELCAMWADLVVEEFCLQGDKEKELGLEVSPMCDRDAIVLCNMQMGFIEFVVAPLIIAVVNVFPTLHEIGTALEANYQQWGQRRVQEIRDTPAAAAGNTAEEVAKLEERMRKFKDKMAFVSALQSLPQRKRISFQKQ